LTELRRESIGSFDLAQTVTSDELQTLDRETVLARAGLTIGEALAHLPVIALSAAAADGVREGRLPAAELAAHALPLVAGECAQLTAPDGELVAIVAAVAGGEGEEAMAVGATRFRFWRVLAGASWSRSAAKASG
jgi:tRNA U55 pseudouridine synthase TruB